MNIGLILGLILVVVVVVGIVVKMVRRGDAGISIQQAKMSSGLKNMQVQSLTCDEYAVYEDGFATTGSDDRKVRYRFSSCGGGKAQFSLYDVNNGVELLKKTLPP